MIVELLKNQENFQPYLFHLSEISLTAEIFLSCSILQLTFYLISTTTQKKYNFVSLTTQIYSIGALILFLASLLLLNEDLLVSGSLSASNSIINDYLSFSAKLVICITSVLYVLILKINSEDEPIQHNFEYVLLILISVLGSLLICSSNDLLTAYLSIELQSVAFYLMAAFKKNSSYSIKSGLKYFIIGSLSSALFLFGSSIIYGCIGSLNFYDIKIFYSLLTIQSTDNNLNSWFSLVENKMTSLACYLIAFGWWAEFSFYLTKSSTEIFPISFINDFYFYKFCVIEASNSSDLFSWVAEKKEGTNLLKDLFVFKFACSLEPFLKNEEKLFSEFVGALSRLREQNFDETMLYSKKEFFKTYHINPSHGYNTSYYGFADLVTANVFPKESGISFYTMRNLLFLENNLKINTGTLIENLDKSVFNSYFDFLQNIWNSNNLSVSSYIQDIKNTMVNLNLISIGFIFICVSLFIKLALAPFHFWSLDVYEGSPNYTTAFFAIVPKIAIFVLLFRFCYLSFFDCFYNQWQTWFFLLAVFSIFVGSVGGLKQRKLKTLLAYSSINHTGYLMLAFSSGSVDGILMMFYYLTIFMISGLCFWSVFLFLRPKENKYFDKHNKELGDLVLLRESNPMLAFILAITLFSLAGIPPLVGFLAKIGVFLAAMGSSAYLISIISILLSVISTFYYIRIIKILYFENTIVGKLYLPISVNKSLLISILSLMLILLCVNPTSLYLFFIKAGLVNIF